MSVTILNTFRDPSHTHTHTRTHTHTNFNKHTHTHTHTHTSNINSYKAVNSDWVSAGASLTCPPVRQHVYIVDINIGLLLHTLVGSYAVVMPFATICCACPTRAGKGVRVLPLLPRERISKELCPIASVSFPPNPPPPPLHHHPSSPPPLPVLFRRKGGRGGGGEGEGRFTHFSRLTSYGCLHCCSALRLSSHFTNSLRPLFLLHVRATSKENRRDGSPEITPRADKVRWRPR